MEELIQSMDNDYEALVPAPNSSVGTDYPTRQAALGALYTTRSMGLIYQQNQEMLSRQGELADKYDQIIEQKSRNHPFVDPSSRKGVEPVEDVPGTPGSGYSGNNDQ